MFLVLAKPHPSISLVIPAYNESSRILPVLENYLRFLNENFDRFELIVVPNNCSDDTPQVAQSFAQRNKGVSVLNLPHYTGKGGAVHAGFAKAKMDWVGFTDADQSTAPREFSKLCDVLHQNRSIQGAIGSRAIKGSRLLKKQPFYRMLLGRGLNVLVWLLFGLPFPDTQCGAKLFRREAVDSVLPLLQVKGWEFDVELLWRLKQQGFTVQEIPVDWLNCEQTKLKLSSVIGMLWGLIRLRFAIK